MLHVEALNQYYEGSHILRDLSVTAPKGACTCLMGRNGMGKTTLLKCIMGLLPIRSGVVEFEGDDLTRRPAETRAPCGIGYVPQGRMIFPLLSVEENLRVGLSARNKGRRGIPDLVFEIFPVLAEMRRRLGGDLSGGQQQQLAIARSLVIEPRLLILDEPTEGIQPNIVHEIGNVIKRLNRELGLTILLAEQKLNFTKQVADNYFVMVKGQVVSSGAIDALDDHVVNRYLTV